MDYPKEKNYSSNGKIHRYQRKPKAGDFIYRTLKDEILSGEIEPGELLSESNIAQRFDVSRTPVREAINRLVCDGLILSLPQRGHMVRTISLSEVLEAFRLREILEVEAAGEAALRITDSDISYLKSLMHKREDLVNMNYEFHTAIARMSGNRLLADFVEELLTLMQRLLINHPDLLNAEPEIKIIKALEDHDSSAAKEAMRSHIREARDLLLNTEHSNH